MHNLKMSRSWHDKNKTNEKTRERIPKHAAEEHDEQMTQQAAYKGVATLTNHGCDQKNVPTRLDSAARARTLSLSLSLSLSQY